MRTFSLSLWGLCLGGNVKKRETILMNTVVFGLIELFFKKSSHMRIDKIIDFE